MNSHSENHQTRSLISPESLILITGAQGFIGNYIVDGLLARGYRNLRCLCRSTNTSSKLRDTIEKHSASSAVEILKGNLLSKQDCEAAVQNARIIYHLAAGRGEKSVPDGFMNSVVTTRNLLDATLRAKALSRFVSVSSFAVYSNQNKPRRSLLDESCPVETKPHLRGDSYSYAKIKQDELVQNYGRQYNLPYVIVRPGVVYGTGNEKITGRVGIGTFGIFLHLGGGNPIPFTYVENCADAIILAGLKPGIDGEVFNIVDDNVPSSRKFLRTYKQQVRPFKSIYVPHFLSYCLCSFWEKYSHWSQGQLPPVYNRAAWHAFWKRTNYSNEKIKKLLGWSQRVPTRVAIPLFLQSCKARANHA